MAITGWDNLQVDPMTKNACEVGSTHNRAVWPYTTYAPSSPDFTK